MITIEKITAELHNAYNLINTEFFSGKLPIVAITIQSESRRKLTMGWCTTKEIWGDKEGKSKMYEINLTPEFLDLDFYETMDTLMHEMVHLYNIINNIQDVSRNGTYHNIKFRDKSINVGFEYKEDKPDKKYGWSFSRLSQKTKNKLDRMDIDQSVFSIARRSPGYFQQIRNGQSSEAEEARAKQTTYKWVCPSCEGILRTTKLKMNIICGDCNCNYQVQE